MRYSDDILWRTDLSFQREIIRGRPLPKRCAEIRDIAEAEGLSHPLGRALYAINRLHNGGWPGGSYNPLPLADFLRRTRVETAIRWEKHWAAGGRIKRLAR